MGDSHSRLPYSPVCHSQIRVVPSLVAAMRPTGRPHGFGPAPFPMRICPDMAPDMTVLMVLPPDDPAGLDG